MMRGVFWVPSRLGRSARPMFWTISTWDPRVSANVRHFRAASCSLDCFCCFEAGLAVPLPMSWPCRALGRWGRTGVLTGHKARMFVRIWV